MEVLLYVCTPRKSTDVTVPGGGAMYGNLWVPQLTYHQFACVIREVIATPIHQGRLQLGGVDLSRSIAIYHLEPLLCLRRNLGILWRKCSGRSGIATLLTIRIVALSL